MKFQLKALAAAVVLASVAVPASANFDLSPSGNGSMVLTVLDRVAGISATFDLGKNFSDFTIAGTSFANSGVTASGTAFSWDLTTNPDYASAWGAFASSDVANLQYGISGADNGGVALNGGRSFITTYTALGNLTTGQVQTTGSNMDTYLNANTSNEALTQNHTTVANGSSTINATSLTGYGGTYYNGDKNYNVGAPALGHVGSDIGILQYVTGASAFATAPITIFGNGAKFNLSSTGALTYSTNPVAPVPEADTYAMMLAGLGLMGFVARRRNQVK